MRKSYEEHVDKLAKQHGIDPDLVKAVIQQESAWNEKAVSPKGATGLMQLMPATAKELGVDPTDPFQNIDGGVRYLSQLSKRYKGDTDKTLAAYNWGMGNLEKQGLENAPPETKNYLTKVKGNMEWPGEVVDSWPGEVVDEWPGEVVDKEGPPFRRVVGQATADLVGASANALSGVAGGLMDYLPGDWEKEADAVRQWGEKQKEEWSTHNLTPEERKQVGTGTQIAAELLGKGPFIAGAAMINPVVGIGYGLTMAAETAFEYLKKGGSVEAAEKIFGVQAVANAMEMFLPAKAIGKGATAVGKNMIVGGPVAGGAADAASRAIAETPELGQMFPDWNDPAARGTDFVLAGASAVGAKAAQKPPSSNDLPPQPKVEPPDYTDQKALYTRWGGDPRLGEFQRNAEVDPMAMSREFAVDENGMPINRQLTEEIRNQVEVEPSEADVMTKADAMGVGFEEARQLIKNGYIEDPKVLGAPPVDPTVKIESASGKLLSELPRESTVGEVAARIAYDFDLFSKKTGKPMVEKAANKVLDLIFEKIFTKVSDVKVRFDDNLPSAHYFPSTHEIVINPKSYGDLFQLKRVLAHESIHALLSREMMSSPEGRYARATRQLMTITDIAFDRMAMKDGITMQGSHGGDYKWGFYAFKNEHEFLAELTQPEFQTALKNVKLSPPEQRAFYKALYGKNMPPSASGMFKTAWNAITRMVGDLFGVKPHEFTALEGLMEIVSAKADNPKSGNLKWTLWKNGMLPSLDAPPTKFTKTTQQTEAKQYFLDRRTWDEIKAEVPRPTKDAEGIGVGAGLTTSSWRLDKQKMSRSVRQNPAFIFASWGFDQLQLAANRKNARWMEASPLLKELKAAIRPHGPLGESKYQKRQNQQLFAVAQKIENDWFQWHNGKDFWPSTQELMNRGLSAAGVKAYQAFTKVADFEWKMLEQYAKVTGRELPPRLPGYIPHFWSGMYKVVLKGKDGSPSHIFRFKSRNEAKRIMPVIEEQANKYGLSFEFKNDKKIHEPDFNDRSMGELLNAYQEMATVLTKASRGGHDKIWSKIALAVDAKQRESITNEQFERLPRPVRGHELDLFANGNLKDISNKDLVDGITDRFVRVNDLLASAEVIHQVWKPILNSNYLNSDTTPQALRFLDDAMMQFTGINRNAFSSIDAALERFVGKLGGDPKMGKAMGSYINGLASVYYLTNEKFLHATIVQPTELLSQLPYLDSYLYAIGHPGASKGSVGTSMLRVIGKGLHPQNLLDNLRSLFDIPNLAKIKNPGLREAIRRGAISPSQMESLFPNKGVFKMMLPAKKMEMAGRLFTYLVTRDYVKDKGLSETEATDAAVAIINKTMVPYDPSLGRPTQFENFGMAGNIFQTFMTYSAHKVGSLYTQAKAIKQYDNPKAQAKAFQAFMTGIGMQAILAGVAGIPFVSNYDELVEIVNDVFGTHYDTAKTAVLKLFSKENIPNDKVRGILENMAAYGAYNYAVQGVEQGLRDVNNWSVDQFGRGYKVNPEAPLTNLTSSMSGVSIMMPFAVPEMAWNLIKFSGAVTKEARTGIPASKDDYKKITHSMPWFIKTPAEYVLKNKTIKDAYRQLVFDDVKNNPDIVTDNKNLPTKIPYERTDQDRSALFHLGAKSVREEKTMMVIRNILRKTRAEAMKGTQWLQLFKEDVLYNSLSPREQEMVWNGLIEQFKENAPDAVINYFKQNTPYDKFPQSFRKKPNLYEIYLNEMGELDE